MEGMFCLANQNRFYLLLVFFSMFIFSKFIIGFRKEQVNANLLNGKGEIENVELNCSFLNNQLRALNRYLELESVRISKISFHVTSWTNLRKSPICIDVDGIVAEIREPLDYNERTKRAMIRQLTLDEYKEELKAGILSAAADASSNRSSSSSSSYNLLDRILDNLSIEIRSLEIMFQPLGKFKTRRVGPWTPPAIQFSLFDLRLVSVNEYGQEAPPSEIWRHNHHHRHHINNKKHPSSILIYKRLTTEYQISLLRNRGKRIVLVSSSPSFTPSDDLEESIYATTTTTTHACSTSSSAAISKQLEVQFATKRRIHDGEYMAIQIDAILHQVCIEMASHPHVTLLAETVAALVHCFAKDRAFSDPLKPEQQQPGDYNDTTTTRTKETNTTTSAVVHEVLSKSSQQARDGEQDKIAGEGEKETSSETLEQQSQKEALGSTSILDLDGLSSSSSSSEEEEDEENDDDDETENDSGSDKEEDVKIGKDEIHEQQNPTRHVQRDVPKTATELPIRPRESRPRPVGPNDQDDQQLVLVLPSGLAFHEKVSLSISIHQATLILRYSRDEGNVQIVANGVVAESIWPKVTKEKGGYVQASVAYLSIREYFQHEQRPRRSRTLLVGGAPLDDNKYNGLAADPTTTQPPLSTHDESFPLYEDRSIRPDPILLRHSFPAQAIGLKVSIDFVEKEPPNDEKDRPTYEMIASNELGIDQFEIVLDSSPWSRIVGFFLNVEGGGFDKRWFSGDWTELISANMLLRPGDPLVLEDCVQPTKKIHLDDNKFISSDLFNATIRMTILRIRVPADISRDARSCDILTILDELTLTASSALPRTLLNSLEIVQFPDEDPSDRQRGIKTFKPISTFRLQLTTHGLSIRLLPFVPFNSSVESQSLLMPCEMTMIVCFEGELPSDIAENAGEKLLLVGSVLAHRFDINVDFDLIASAVTTLSAHSQQLAERKMARNLNSSQQSSEAGIESRIHKSMRGHGDMVRCHINHSRSSGGLSLGLVLRASGFCARLWRQHVTRNSPLRPVQNFAVDGCIPSLMLAKFSADGIDFSAESSLQQKSATSLVKLKIKTLHIEACSFSSLQMLDTPWQGSIAMHGEGNVRTSDVCNDFHHEICSFGRTSSTDPAILLRLEDMCINEMHSIKVSSSIANGNILCFVQEVEHVFLLTLEALLLPTWGTQEDDSRCQSTLFPRNSVGNLLFSFFVSRCNALETISI
jgi:hypothetical protein